jgi:hypothetical protein
VNPIAVIPSIHDGECAIDMREIKMVSGEKTIEYGVHTRVFEVTLKGMEDQPIVVRAEELDRSELVSNWKQCFLFETQISSH